MEVWSDSESLHQNSGITVKAGPGSQALIGRRMSHQELGRELAGNPASISCGKVSQEVKGTGDAATVQTQALGGVSTPRQGWESSKGSPHLRRPNEDGQLHSAQLDCSHFCIVYVTDKSWDYRFCSWQGTVRKIILFLNTELGKELNL